MPTGGRLTIALLTILGCGSPLPAPPPPADASALDFGVDGGLDFGSPDLGPCPERLPEPPYGIDTGDALEPFRFDDCESTPRDLYGCDGRALVVNFAAGWCVPCFEETAQLRSEIVERYGDSVRVVQILFEDAEYGPVEPTECRQWVERFGTTGIETLMADTAEVTPYLVESSVPTTFVLDGQGRIRLALEGTETGLPNIRAALDAILGE